MSRLNPFSTVLNDAKEGLGLYGLAHNSKGTSFLGFLRNVVKSRHYYDRNVGKKRILASLGEKPPAIEYWHLQVQKNHGRTNLRVGKQLKRFASIPRTLDRVALQRQEFR
jgi:hypothetical protein